MAPMQALDPRRREDSQLSPRLSSNGFAIVVLCVLIIIAILPDSGGGGSAQHSIRYKIDMEQISSSE